MADNHSLVSIHIDNKEVKSPNPTTGGALYNLGGIDAAQYDLFRETHHGDDEPILNNTTPVTLKDGDHFFSVQKKLNPGA